MKARVFLHPRCLSGPALGALQAHLHERGWDLDALRIGPPSGRKGYCELTRLVSEAADGTLTLERLDGHRFDYRSLSTPPGGHAA